MKENNMIAKKKTVHYRRVILDGKIDGDEGDSTLQDHLENIINMIDAKPPTIKKPIRRALGVGDDCYQVLTWLKKRQKCVVGETVFYEPKKKVSLVDFPDGETWQGLADPRDEEGNNRNLQEHKFVFAVRENHLAMITSKGFDGNDFQDFLAWLLQDATKLADGTLISLQNLPAKTAMEKVRDSPVKAVKIGNQAFGKIREEIPEEERVKSKSRKKFRHHVTQNEKVTRILECLGLPLFDIPSDSDPGQISLDVKVSYRGGAEKAGAEMVRNLAACVGDIDGVKTTIYLEKGGKIQNGELTIRGEVNVMHDGGNMSSDDAWTRLAEWLFAEIKAKRIFT